MVPLSAESSVTATSPSTGFSTCTVTNKSVSLVPARISWGSATTVASGQLEGEPRHPTRSSAQHAKTLLILLTTGMNRTLPCIRSSRQMRG